VTWLRTVLSRKVSVEAMIELAMWLAIPYIAIGLVWSFLHPEPIQVREQTLQIQIPAGADLIAFGESTLLWPVLMLAPAVCTAA
jgi:hypothetical protein